jgi:hypothetical protein
MQRVVISTLVTGLALCALFGCTPPTSFQGDAQFPGGALGCFNQCQKIKMEMASFVYVGAYSTACACKPQIAPSSNGAAPSSSQPQTSAGEVEGAVLAASAGVEMQRRRIAEQQQQQQQLRPGQ